MQTYECRRFLQLAVAAGAERLFAGTPPGAAKKALRLGLLVSVANDPENVLASVQRLGLPTAHVEAWDFSPAMAARLRAALDRYKVEATVLYSAGRERRSTTWSMALPTSVWSLRAIGVKESIN